MVKFAKPRASRIWAIAAACAAAGCMVSGCSHHASSSAGSVVVPYPPALSPAASNPTATPEPSTASSFVAYKIAGPSQTAHADANGLTADPVSNPTGEPVSPKYLLNQLASGSDSPLPPGTQVLGVKVDAASKLVTVDFSKEFQTNFQGGETREAQAIESVLETLGQLPDVQKVQILVGGRKIDSLGGSEELDEPLPTPQSSSNVATINKP